MAYRCQECDLETRAESEALADVCNPCEVAGLHRWEEIDR